MSKVIEVIYQNGVFKPLKKVKLKEGEILRIEIKEARKITKRFRDKLSELRSRVERVEDAHKVLEELRDARY